MEVRLRSKLDKLLSENKTYESEQLAITLFSRLIKLNKPEEARHVLVTTAIRLSDLKDSGAAGALSSYFVDHLKKEKVVLDDVVLKEIDDLSCHFAQDVKLLDEYTDSVVKYAPENKEVRKVVISRYRKLKRFGKSYMHAVKIDDPQCLSEVLIDWAFDENTAKEEKDLIICRGILECLALGQLDTCNQCFVICAKKWKEIPYEPTPLLNCVAFVIKVLRMQNGQSMLLELRARYSDSLDRDPIFDTFLDICETKYFANQNNNNGPNLMSLISGMFGGGN